MDHILKVLLPCHGKEIIDGYLQSDKLNHVLKFYNKMIAINLSMKRK